MARSLDDKKREFQKYVWNHSIDPTQVAFDTRPPLSPDVIDTVREIAELSDRKDERSAELCRKILFARPDVFYTLLQLCGLTRSKILTDLSAAVTYGSGVRVPAVPHRLTATKQGWLTAWEYLRPKIRNVFRHLEKAGDHFSDAVEALNQATWPGYVRQQRAKMSGHQAEGRLAVLLRDVGIPFQPERKAEQPLCPDAQINGISFDIVIPSVAHPKIVVKSTVHTSNIGQFGESKDDLEIMEARDWLDDLPDADKPVLLALIDGIGFRSNRAGLDGVLDKSHAFCQYRTLWKAAAIAASSLRLDEIRIYLPTEQISDFRYLAQDPFLAKRIRPLDELDGADRAGLIEAGDAFIRPLRQQAGFPDPALLLSG